MALATVEDELTETATGHEYIAFWETTVTGWLDDALSQVGAWLREPSLRLDLDLRHDGEISEGGRRAQVLHRANSSERGVRIRVSNSNGGASFVTTILAVESPRGGWLWLQTTSSDPRRPAAKPRVADKILDVVDFSDGGPIRGGARHVNVEGLTELEELLDHPRRRLPVIIASPIPDYDFAPWHDYVTKWTARCAGIAHVVSLDPASAAEFAARHPTSAVQPGTLRTFPPGLTLDDDAMPGLARWLSSATLAERDDRAIARTIESFVRRSQIEHPFPVPSAVREWNRAFDRIAGQRLRADLAPRRSERAQQIVERRTAPATSVISLPTETEGEAAQREAVLGDLDAAARDIRTAGRAVGDAQAQEVALDAALVRLQAAETEVVALRARLDQSEAARRASNNELERLRIELGLTDLSPASIEELLELATQEKSDPAAVEHLLAENDSLVEQHERAEAELAASQETGAELRRDLSRVKRERDKLSRYNNWLRLQLETLQPGRAYEFTDEPEQSPTNPLGEAPATWKDLIEQLPNLNTHGVCFTGSDRPIKELVSLDASGEGLAACWDALGTIAAYVSARTTGMWTQNMDKFCESGPPGAFHVPKGKHSPDEQSGTRKDKRMADERIFNVPSSVSKDGHTYMWAHFKPHTWSAQQRLRVHYYDQASEDGYVYVGYIGHHLTSGSTDKVKR